MVSQNKQKQIVKSWTNPGAPGAFSGINKLKEHNVRFSTKELKETLKSEPGYTRHAPKRRRFKRRGYMVANINHLWQCDLLDLTTLHKTNNGYKYILVTVDVFSKFAYVEKMKLKSGIALCTAFKKIMQRAKKRGRLPLNLQTDKGTEFKNKQFKALLLNNNINFYTTNNEQTKASVVERLIRTLKTKLFRYFTYKNTRKYVDVIQKIVDSYNKTYHRSIGMTPIEVKPEHQKDIFYRLHENTLFDSMSPRTNKQTFYVGDKVRLANVKDVFAKGYTENWTEEIFKVKGVNKRFIPYTYTVVDLMNDPIEGSFYSSELLEVEEPVYHRIEKIIRRQGNAALVRWVGYPKKFDSLIPYKDIKLYKK